MGDKSILDYLCGKDYEIALMTTFNFEIEFFERFVLNQLYDNNIRKVSLFVDSKELNKSIMNIESSYIGKKYFVTPIEMNASFHPKVFLLLGEKKARLIVGSSNLTRTGLKSNNEIFNVFDYDENNIQNLALIKDAMKFFEKLHNITETEKDLFDQIKFIGYLDKNAINNESYFLNNIEKSIMDQIKEIIKENIKSIDIAVPYYDNELLALNEIKNRYSSAKINLYIQNKTSTFNFKYNQKNKIILENDIIPFSKCECNNSNNFYHGKVIRFNGENKSYILYGSANCTLSALINSYNDLGNIECDVFEIGESNEFDYFFENFVIEYPEILENQTIEQESISVNNFNFKYIEENTILKLSLGYKKKIDNIEIFLKDEKLEYQYDNKKIIVFLPLEVMSTLENIFDIKVCYDNKEEKIRCWYNNIQSISLFREASDTRNVTKIRVPDEGTIFMEDEELIIRTMADNPEEIEFARKHILNKKIENEEENEYDDFKIDDDIPDEYIRKYKEYEHVNNCVKKLANHYFLKLKNNITQNNNSNNYDANHIENKQIDDKDEIVTHIRKATEPEKRFERLVKSKINDLLNPDRYTKKTYVEYRDLIGFFFGIFDKYKYQEKIEDIFLDKYVIEVKFKLLEILLSKSDENNINENKEDNIIMTLMIIIETDYINSLQEQIDYKVETKNKSLLKQIDSLYHIRNNFNTYLEASIDIINKRTIDISKELKIRENKESSLKAKDVYLIRDIIPINSAVNVIERLYGYKTNKELLEVIKKFYGENCRVQMNQNNIIVEVNVLEVGKYINREDSAFKQMLKEIKNYSKNVSNIDSLEVTINITKGIGLIKMEYTIDINVGKMNRKMFYTNIDSKENEFMIRIL